MGINRDDMLELTRRMTPSRTCFTRVAGCYVDADGDFDGSFNIHFGKLNAHDREQNLAWAKTIPFASTNEQLCQYPIAPGKNPTQSVWALLMTLRNVGLKNDAMMDTFYDLVMEHYQASGPYAIFMYHGSYDVPIKGSDKEYQKESEEVYNFLIGTGGGSGTRRAGVRLPFSGVHEPKHRHGAYQYLSERSQAPAYGACGEDTECENIKGRGKLA